MSNEESRLSVLNSYDILDTPAASEFDDIAYLACRTCKAPIGLVGFIAPDRQWFKARSGFASPEIPLSQSVCAIAVGSGRDLFVVPDLTEDPLTRNNPLVTGALGVRYYAGAILRTTQGAALGTVCVYDTARRDGLAAEEATSLQALARLTMILLELHRAVGPDSGFADFGALH